MNSEPKWTFFRNGLWTEGFGSTDVFAFLVVFVTAGTIANKTKGDEAVLVGVLRHLASDERKSSQRTWLRQNLEDLFPAIT